MGGERITAIDVVEAKFVVLVEGSKIALDRQEGIILFLTALLPTREQRHL